MIWTGMGFGSAAYCLVLLVSRDAPLLTLSLMGVLALAVIVACMAILWSPTAECPDQAKLGQEPAGKEPDAENLSR